MIALVVYPIIAGLAICGLKRKDSLSPMKWLAILAGGGILFNSFIIYKEVTVINAYCYLCLICTALIVTIFGISSMSYFKNKK